MSGRQSSRGLGPVPDLVPLSDDSQSESRVSESFTAVDIEELTGSNFPDPELDPFLTGKSEKRAPVLSGPIHPLMSSKTTWMHHVVDEMSSLAARRKPRQIMIASFAQLIILVYLTSLVGELESLCLGSFVFINSIQMMSLLACLLHFWALGKRPSPHFSYGYARFEVLASFAIFTYAIFSALMAGKEGLEHYIMLSDSRRMAHPHHPMLLTTAFVSFAFQLVIHYIVENVPLQHVIEHSESTIFQKELHSIVSFFSFANSNTRPNPLVLLSVLSLISVAISDIMVVFGWTFQASDLFGAFLINVIILITMKPLAAYCGAILLQATPPHLAKQLDNLRSELTTMDGVLEVKNAHFWSTGFTSTAGTIHVRVSRNTNQQQVLAHIILKVYPIVPNCDIQIMKDDWASVTKKTVNYTISTKHVEHLKDLNIPSMSTSAAPASKLSSLIKSKAPKQSVNRLSTFSTLK